MTPQGVDSDVEGLMSARTKGHHGASVWGLTLVNWAGSKKLLLTQSQVASSIRASRHSPHAGFCADERAAAWLTVW